jgi:hypothetical protein
MKIIRLAQGTNDPEELLSNLQTGLTVINDMSQRIKTSGLQQILIDVLSGKVVDLLQSGQAQQLNAAALQTLMQEISQLLQSVSLVNQSLTSLKTLNPNQATQITSLVISTLRSGRTDQFVSQVPGFLSMLGQATKTSAPTI